jgi:hypothetical protein
MTPFPPERVASGATNTPNPTPGTPEAFQAVSDDLRARLAGLVRQPPGGPVSTPTEAYALRVADALLADGFRRVVDDDEVPTRHACCPHCTARTGSCVRCGVRDAAEGEELCGECDTAVEAEVTGRGDQP